MAATDHYPDDDPHALDDALALSVPDAVEPDVVPDQDETNRLLRRRARLVRDFDSVNALCDREIERIQAWRSARLTSPQREIERIDALLDGFMRAVKARSGGKTKSLKLPNGTLKLTAPGAPRAVIPDPEAFVRWAVDTGRKHWLRFPPPPDPEPDLKAMKADLKPSPTPSGPCEPGCLAHAAIDSDGEVIPGVVFHVKQADKFAVLPTAYGPDDLDEEGAE